MLDVQDLHAFYGKSHVLQGVSLRVGAGEMVTLLGRNGVGKSTTLKAIIGLVPRRAAGLRFGGHDLAGLATHDIARLGIGYVPEERRIFGELTVLENLRLGMAVRGWDTARQAAALGEAYAYFPRLAERSRQLGATLSGGEQQMLAIARAVVPGPRLLLIDEPTEGLAPGIVAELEQVIRRLAAGAGMGILLVEQNFRLALRMSDRAYLMEKGTIRHQGRAADVAGSPDLLRKHLGVA